MIGIKGFGLGVLGKKKESPSSSGMSGISGNSDSGSKNKGAYNICYDSIIDSHNAVKPIQKPDSIRLIPNEEIKPDRRCVDNMTPKQRKINLKNMAYAQSKRWA